MSPQLVIGGCAPRPKKLNPLSIKIEAAKLAAEITIRGDIIFGKICLVIILNHYSQEL